MNNPFSDFDPCGIEVSAQTLLAALGGEARAASRGEFANTAEGHRALLAWLKRWKRPVRVVMESTGLYGLDLALCLQRAGVELMVANPRAVRHFAQAMMKRSKTDRIDAEVLRQFAARMPFVAWRPPSAAALKLVAVVRRLEALTEMLAAEKNRLHAASLSEALPAIVRRDVQRSIQTQQRAIQRLTRAAQEFVISDPELGRRYQLLLSIPGFATTSALHTLAELALLARGKTKMQALVAVMRKLLHAIFGMFKHNQTFDGTKVYSLLPATTPELATQEVA
ncbi:MAG: transposase [Acidobacteriota bacterium]